MRVPTHQYLAKEPSLHLWSLVDPVKRAVSQSPLGIYIKVMEEYQNIKCIHQRLKVTKSCDTTTIKHMLRNKSLKCYKILGH